MGIQVLTAGESHGKGYMGIIEGLPCGFKLDVEYINRQLYLRQHALGRGERANSIEQDKVEIYAGLYKGYTTGAPIGIIIKNYDVWDNEKLNNMKLTTIRPNHADFGGVVKYGLQDARIVAERASARQTIIDTAMGAICRQMLTLIGIEISGWVVAMGKIVLSSTERFFINDKNATKIIEEESNKKQQLFVDELSYAKDNGFSLGGKVLLLCSGMRAGLGGYSQPNKRLGAMITSRLMGINAVKAVEIGIGSQYALINSVKTLDSMHIKKPNKADMAHTKNANNKDSISDNVNNKINSTKNTFSTDTTHNDFKDIVRSSNYSGGIDGGISSGEDIILQVSFKPIPSIQGIATVDINTMKDTHTKYERGDTTAVFAGNIVAQNVLAISVLSTILDASGADTIEQLVSYNNK